MLIRFLPVIISMLLVVGCNSSDAVRQPAAKINSISRTSNVVSDRLFFGRSIPHGGEVSDSAWTDFLSKEITPRFLDGLTVWQAAGQWMDSTKRLIRENVAVVEIIHQDKIAIDSLLEVIAESYRKRFKQEAVLRVTEPARIHLYEGTKAN